MAERTVRINILGNAKPAQQAFAEAEEAAGGFLSKIGGVVGNLAGGLAVFDLAAGGIGRITGAVGGLINGFMAGNKQFETYLGQFETLLGSAEAAEARMKELARIGAETPFELPELVEADRILQAFGFHAEDAAQRFGFSGEQIRIIAGDVAAGVGVPIQEIANNLGKFVSGATGTAIQRFSELGIVTREQLAQMGLEFSKSGQLLSPLPQATEVLLRAMNEKFGGQMDVLSSTMEGKLANLADRWDELKRNLAAPLFEVAHTGMSKFLELLEHPAIDAFVEQAGTALAGAVERAMNLFIALAQVLAGPVGRAFGLVRDAVLTFAQAIQGDWADDSRIHPFHRAVGQIGTVLREWVLPAIEAVAGFFQSFFGDGVAGSERLFGALEKLFGVELGDRIGSELTDIVALILGRVIPAFGQIVEFIGRVAAAFQQGGLGAAAREALSGLADAWTGIEEWLLGTALPRLVETLGSLAGAFLDWIGPMIPPLLRELGGFLETIVSWIANEGLPLIVANLATWGQALIAWIGPRIGPVLSELWALLADLGQWFVNDALPAIIEYLSQWGGELIAWIGPRIGPMLRELWRLLGELGTWLIDEALPELVSKLAEWGAAFIAWVGPQIPPLLGELGTLLLHLGDWILTEALPELVSKLAEWGAAFLGWIATDVLPYLAEKAGEILVTLGAWLTTEAIPWAGRELASLGTAIVEGLWEGIKSLGSWIWQQLTQWVTDNIPGPIKRALGISSPSRVTAEFGRELVAGFIVGMDESQLEAARSAAEVAAQIVDALRGALELGTGSGLALPSMELVSRVKFWAEHAIRSFGDTAAILGEELVSGAEQVAGAIGATIGVLRDAFALARELNAEDVTAFVVAVEWIEYLPWLGRQFLEQMAEGVSLFAGPVLEATEQLAGAVSATVGAAGDVLTLARELIGLEPPEDGVAVEWIEYLPWLGAQLTRQLSEARAYLTGPVAAETGEIGEAIRAAVGGVTEALGFVTRLGEVDPALLERELAGAVDTLSALALQAVAGLRTIRDRVGEEAIAAGEAAGAAVTAAFGGLTSALDFVLRAGELSPRRFGARLERYLDQLEAVLERTITRLSAIGVALGGERLDAARAAAEAAGSVIAALAAALDLRERLRDTGAGGELSGAVEGLVSFVDGLVTAVAERVAAARPDLERAGTGLVQALQDGIARQGESLLAQVRELARQVGVELAGVGLAVPGAGAVPAPAFGTAEAGSRLLDIRLRVDDHEWRALIDERVRAVLAEEMRRVR